MENSSECYAGPIATNMKCIVFTLLLSLGYWFLPKRNKWVLICMLYFPYLALAWYDYLYVCERNMGPTYLAHFYSFFKPQSSDQIKKYHNLCPDIAYKLIIIDSIVFISILLLIPMFIRWKPK